MALIELIGATVKGKSGDVDVASLADNDVVGLYFSAHWCPPCQMFTPVLAQYYKTLREAGKKLEVVFISGDDNETNFANYYENMPWLALPFPSTEIRGMLAKLYEVKGIPMLVMLDAKTGQVITKEGRGLLKSDPEGAKFPWKE